MKLSSEFDELLRVLKEANGKELVINEENMFGLKTMYLISEKDSRGWIKGEQTREQVIEYLKVQARS